MQADNKTYYTPGDFWPKLAHLIFSLVVFGIGLWFVYEPFSRMVFGESVEARVVEIRERKPGEPIKVIRYRKQYKESTDFRVVYEHYVSVPVNGTNQIFRISVDSRKSPVPYLNVNDSVTVSYYPDDENKLAFAHKDPRTWGIAGLFASIGAIMFVTALPTLLAVGKPIEVDL